MRPLLLQTKLLIPRVMPTHIPRPHLVEQVHSHLHDSLTIVTAPAGYGKTSLAAELVAALEVPALWYQLDANDNDPSTFLAYFVEGLRSIFPEAAENVQHFLTTSGANPPERTLTIILNELTEAPETRWVWVLDDYHFINNPAVHALVTTLIENKPPGMHIILATRNHPPLPVARWRVRGRMTELREEHLRFSAEEVSAWMSHSNRQLSESVLKALVEKTEGWGAGIHLVTVLFTESMSSAQSIIDGLKGDHPYIFEYLMEEVFERQPAHRQQFLLHSATLNQINAETCRHVLGSHDAALMLDALEQENLFVVRLDKQWFRYHHLFREFLLNRLAQIDPDLLTALQKAAGEYYRHIQQYETATHYFLLTGDIDQAAMCLRQFGNDYLDQGRLDALRRYLSQLTPGAFSKYPDLLLMFGFVQRSLGSLHAAIANFEQVSFGTTSPDCRCAAFTELAGIARSQGDYQRAHDLARSAVQISPPESPARRAFALMEQAKCEGFLIGMNQGRILAEDAISQMRQAGTDMSAYHRAQLLRSLGQICWWHGDVRNAITHCEEALACLPDDVSPLSAHILITLATPYLYRHDYKSALAYSERALTISERLDLQELRPTIYAVLGNALTRVGQLTRAESCLRQAIELAASIGAASYDQVMAGGYLAYNLVAQGKIDEARQVAETALWPHIGQATVYEIFVCRSVLADIHLEMGQFQESVRIFEELITLGEVRQYRIPLAMAYFGLSYIRIHQGHRDQGLLLAQRSLDLINPSQAWELYVDQGERARTVCNVLTVSNPSHPFLASVMAALGGKKKDERTMMVLSHTHPPIRIHSLGSLRVFRGHEEIDPRLWVSAKARDLLAFFITFRHEYSPLDRVVEALWTSDAQHGKAAFHTALYRLRQALRQTGDTSKFIVAGGGDYRLDAAHFDIDVNTFDHLVSQANQLSYEDAQGTYQAALKLYHGPFLNNLYFDWLQPERQRLSDVYLSILKIMETNSAKVGNMEHALALAKQRLAVDPFAEDVHCDVMRYLYRCGDRTGLHKHYIALQTLLQDELGVEPLDHTKHLYLSLGGVVSNAYSVKKPRL